MRKLSVGLPRLTSSPCVPSTAQVSKTTPASPPRNKSPRCRVPQVSFLRPGKDAWEPPRYNQHHRPHIVATMSCSAREGVCLRVLFLFVLATALPANAQLTFNTAIDLALENSLKVKSAEQDVKKAGAALAVTKDIFIPSVVTAGGVGTAYGITLNVPTIFTVNAQSLVYSAQQRFYIRAARSDLRSAQLELQDARGQAMEDTAITYLSIDHAQKTLAAAGEQY